MHNTETQLQVPLSSSEELSHDVGREEMFWLY